MCGHAHAEKVVIEDLLDHLGVTPAEARGKPRIRLLRGETHLAVAAAARELAKGPYFRSNGSIVRVDEDPDGRVSLQRLNEPSLSPILASSIHWERKLKEGWVQDDPPRQVIQQLLCHNTPHILRLEGVARQPFLRPDGSLVTRPGYDPETCTCGAFRETYNFGVPTEDTARSALAEISALIEGFPTASEADKSAALCLLLTAAIRPSLPQAPAFSITAPLIGSGKSHLAKLAALFASPDEPYTVSYPTTADEATKQMPAMLSEKPAVIMFDDMQTNWLPHGVVNRVLTSPTITERILGEGRMSTVRTNSLFIGTGNEIEPVGDMRRRVVSIRLEPDDDTPALRRFRSDPVAEVRRNRARAVMAALEIIRGYQAAGGPKADVPSIGSYEQWSTWCRQPLLWLGLADPATSLIKQVNHDHDRQARQHFLTLLHDEFGSHPLLVKEIIEYAVRNHEVMEVLDELSMVDRRGVNAKSLGWYLKLKCARPVGGLKVEPVDATQWRTAWKVVRSGGAPARARAGTEWPDETGETGGRPFRPFSDRDDHFPKRRPKKAVAGW